MPRETESKLDPELELKLEETGPDSTIDVAIHPSEKVEYMHFQAKSRDEHMDRVKEESLRIKRPILDMLASFGNDISEEEQRFHGAVVAELTPTRILQIAQMPEVRLVDLRDKVKPLPSPEETIQ